MKNVQTKLTGEILTITVDLSKTFGSSKSGKSIIIATSEGIQQIEGKPNVSIGLNVFKKS
jgi:hypothetical protein